MQKIKSLFKRQHDGDRLLYDEVVPGAEWVLAGEGRATVKIDGTACLIRGVEFLKRCDLKQGKTPPAGFEPVQDPDPVTGHQPGWVTVKPDDPASKWHWQAYHAGGVKPDGTYELIGPKVQGNSYNLDQHMLVKHGDWKFMGEQPPRSFDELKIWFATHIVEGIVWHHANGDLVKIKRKDFGYVWPPVEA